MLRSEPNLYRRLGLDESCSDADVKKKYRALALKLHPDKGGDPEEFKAVSEAYAVLSSAEKRSVYDATGEAELADFDMEEFLNSGVLGDFFAEMMGQSGMAEEMAEMFGDGMDMKDMQASFESFFKASMGMGDGPVLMPDGTTMDAASVPSMAQMAALGDDDDEALRMMLGGLGGAGLLGLGGGARGGRRARGGGNPLDDLDSDDDDIALPLERPGGGGAAAGAAAAAGGAAARVNSLARASTTETVAPPPPPLRAAPVDPSAPPAAQWVQAAKAGDLAALRSLLAADGSLLQSQARGIGNTALHWAASYGHADAVSFLMAQGAPVDFRNNGGSTPLMSAAGAGHLGVIELLLAAGADATATNDGDTAATIAASRGHTEAAARLR